MAPVDPLAEVRVILTGPIGLTLQCANRFINVAGIQSMDSFNMLRPADARTTLKLHNEAHTSAALRQYQLGITYEKMSKDSCTGIMTRRRGSSRLLLQSSRSTRCSDVLNRNELIPWPVILRRRISTPVRLILVADGSYGVNVPRVP